MTNNGPAGLQRCIPLACWVAVLLTTLLVCLKIISYGYLPEGDARRHAAKPFANKPYSQIVVVRPEYVVDHSPGWEWLLGVLHRDLGFGEDGLISFSIASLLIWFFCLPLLWMRRPEAWLAAILALLVAVPELMSRLTQARPFLLTDGLLIAFLLAWSKDDGKNTRWPKLLLTSAGFALSVWMHGAWYLWVLLPAAFFMAQRWRAGVWLTACWAAGTLAGALLTGKPVAFLYGAVFMAASVYQEHLPNWMLVGEFQSSAGEFGSLLVLVLVWLWRRTQNRTFPSLFIQPVFWMIAISWLLGFFADRFWTDWGMPALLVWVALQFDDAMPDVSADDSHKRLMICGLILLPLYLSSTSDLGRRYTKSLEETFVSAGDPDLKGWLPEKDGIFYADNMQFFYDTFYKNPEAEWRYIVGFEPALMPPDDLKIYRAIHRNKGADESYEPWIKKMRPEDRLTVNRTFQPNLPSLEWKRSGDVWIGRLPRGGAGKGKH
jgi:hypothetical protein